MASGPDTVVFDIGAVLLDWDPDYLYRTIIPDPAQRKHFLATIVPDIHEITDRGKPFDQAIAERQQRHPEWAEAIAAYWQRWPETLGGVFEETAALKDALADAGVPLYALSNFSAETFPIARRLYPIFDNFDGIVLSGEVGVTKPDPAIYRWLLARHGLRAEQCLFIDDRPDNIETARLMGFHAIVHTDAAALREHLVRYRLLSG